MTQRVLRDPELIVVRDRFRLKNFIKNKRRNARRRSTYFETIDILKERMIVHWEDEPTTEEIVLLLVQALQNDQTFTAHVRQVSNAAILADADQWRQICHAGAGTIMQEYLRAVERGDWPPEGEGEG